MSHDRDGVTTPESDKTFCVLASFFLPLSSLSSHSHALSFSPMLTLTCMRTHTLSCWLTEEEKESEWVSEWVYVKESERVKSSPSVHPMVFLEPINRSRWKVLLSVGLWSSNASDAQLWRKKRRTTSPPTKKWEKIFVRCFRDFKLSGRNRVMWNCLCRKWLIIDIAVCVRWRHVFITILIVSVTAAAATATTTTAAAAATTENITALVLH